MCRCIFILILLSVNLNTSFSWCHTVFENENICDQLQDIKSYANYNWKHLHVGYDVSRNQCPNESLTERLFENTPDLEILFISGRIRKSEFSAFPQLKKLHHVSLRDNVIDSIDLSVFESLQSLQKLDLNNNSIKSVKFSKSGTISVKTLSLSGNKLTRINLFNAANLTTLDASYNDLSVIATGCFHEKLQYLNLSHNNLEYLSVVIYRPLTRLEKLNVSYNKIRYVPSLAFGGLIYHLDLSYNKIEFIEDGAFENCLKLTYLFLAHNRLTYLKSNIFPLSQSTRYYIISISLHYNLLSKLDSSVLRALKGVNRMSIGGNPWMCQCLMEILAFVGENLINISVCEKEFYSEGKSPVCIGRFDNCSATGYSPIPDSDMQDFESHLIYLPDYCYFL